MDLVQNSVEADASEIDLVLRETDTQIEFIIKDNGKGMSEGIKAKAIDPFYTDGKKHAHRRVGLGLPFMIQSAEAANGHTRIESKEGVGTELYFTAQKDHVDLSPLGDVAAAAVMMISQANGFELRITREILGQSYSVSRSELEYALGDLNDAQNLGLMKTYILSQEEDLRKAG